MTIFHQPRYFVTAFSITLYLCRSVITYLVISLLASVHDIIYCKKTERYFQCNKIYIFGIEVIFKKCTLLVSDRTQTSVFVFIVEDKLYSIFYVLKSLFSDTKHFDSINTRILTIGSVLFIFCPESKTCVNWPLKNRQSKDLNDKW